jgi:hypothetical protein
MIAANSFMKREFGKKLIEEVLPRLDLTHVIDCSGAYIPGHATPTTVLFGRNQAPVASVVRAVMGIRGEPSRPDDPARGKVWSAIVAHTDQPGSTGDFVSVADIARTSLGRHPWSIDGGGLREIKEILENCAPRCLSDVYMDVGRTTHTGEDDFFLLPGIMRYPVPTVPLVLGEDVRDYVIQTSFQTIFPYDPRTGHVIPDLTPELALYAWPYRTSLRARRDFGQSIEERGLKWYEHNMFFPRRWLQQRSIVFAFIATHNHFVLDHGGKVFNRSAPVIKLRSEATEEDHLTLLGFLNSSIACFWGRQTMFLKGGFADGKWEERLEWDGTKLGRFPLSGTKPIDLARALDQASQNLAVNLPAAVAANGIPNRQLLDAACEEMRRIRARMIALQEELDWRCYRLYGLLVDAPEHPNPPGLRLGERAFEIVMARQMADGELETAWFERHGSTPITAIPGHWPSDYSEIVERRIALIESNPQIGLIERPEYKRRWSMPSWEEMEQEALRGWLLDRLEDRRFWPVDDPRLISARQLADAVRRDGDFVSVAELYAGPGFEVETLVAELAGQEAVPFLSALRYTETGLRKHVQWEETWVKQRREDAIDAEVAPRRDEFLVTEATRLHPRRHGETAEVWSSRLAEVMRTPDIGARADRAIKQEQRRRRAEEVGDIPVPPKYNKNDFPTADYWRLRGGLDVPKERFVSFSLCERDVDGSPVVTWAGYDHLARARAVATYYLERKDTDGWEPVRLMPLLAGLAELVPWVRQWHNDYDPATGVRMGDYFGEFVRDEARSLGKTEADLAAWAPPAAPRRGRGRRRPAPAVEILDLSLLDHLP